jgi:hypothetical protein
MAGQIIISLIGLLTDWIRRQKYIRISDIQAITCMQRTDFLKIFPCTLAAGMHFFRDIKGALLPPHLLTERTLRDPVYHKLAASIPQRFPMAELDTEITVFPVFPEVQGSTEQFQLIFRDSLKEDLKTETILIQIILIGLDHIKGPTASHLLLPV